jgi:biopolymer transport protein ExbD
MSEMNVIPLVDTMPVLPVIFVVTEPVVTQSVQRGLPRASRTPIHQTVDNVTLSLDADGHVYGDSRPVDVEALYGRQNETLQAKPELAAYLRADRDTRYGIVVRIMADARRAGAATLAFLSQPEVN